MTRMAKIILSLVLLLAGSCGGGQSGNSAINQSDATYSAVLAIDISGVKLQHESTDDGESVPQRYQLGVIQPKQVLRRIDPGIIPDSQGFAAFTYLGNDTWRITSLPLDEQVLVQIAFTPVVNLYPAGSVNAGSLGGSANSSDGVWADMSIDQVMVGGGEECTAAPSPAGWIALDFSFRPKDASR